MELKDGVCVGFFSRLCLTSVGYDVCQEVTDG